MSDFTMGFVRPVRQGGFTAALQQAVAQVAVMWRARQTRRMLSALDDRMLTDIGIGRGQAQFEATRSMWDLAPRGR